MVGRKITPGEFWRRYEREWRLCGALPAPGFENLIGGLEAQIRQSAGGDPLVVAVRQLARGLWRHACELGLHADVALYRARMQMLFLLHEAGAGDDLLREFDLISRNLQCADESAGEIIWLSGFDPYGLDEGDAKTLHHSNPSGAAMLALQGKRLAGPGPGGREFQIRCAIFPVRFQEFDEGLFEQFVRDCVLRSQSKLFFTVSMGGAHDAFHLDRFPGNRRGVAPDNAGCVAGPAAICPERAAGLIESNLAASRRTAMLGAPGAFAVLDWREVESVERGRHEIPAHAGAGALLAGYLAQDVLRGSGGDYLSNEISYRALCLAGQAYESVHIHTPRLGPVLPDDQVQIGRRQAIVEQIETLITVAAAVAAVPGDFL